MDVTKISGVKVCAPFSEEIEWTGYPFDFGTGLGKIVRDHIENNLIDNLEDRLEIDLHNQKAKYDKQARLQRVTYKIKKTKILEKFSWEDSDYAYAY